MEWTNRHGLPDAIVRAIANDPYDAGDADISVTSLIAPPQMRVLRQQHDAEMKLDVIDSIWSLLGQAVHVILERAEMEGIAETRLYANIAGWRVSGQFDRLVLINGTLQDYKVTSAWSGIHGPKPEWIAQLNCLARLCALNWIDVNKLEIIAIYRDWSRLQAWRSSDYPQTQVGTLPIPLWSVDYVRAYMEERVKLHQVAEKGHVLPCTNEERWLRNETWAIMKPGRKTALKLCDNPEAAEQYCAAKGLVIGTDCRVDHRQGEFVRCQNYCDVAEFCPQWAADKPG